MKKTISTTLFSLSILMILFMSLSTIYAKNTEDKITNKISLSVYCTAYKIFDLENKCKA